MGHDFDWDNIQILGEELCYARRLTSEMLFIKRQKSSLNQQDDTELLHSSYLPIIKKLHKI